MPRPRRRPLRRLADIAIPLLVGLFLVALVWEEPGATLHGRMPGTPLRVLAMCAGAVQGAALWWRRSRPVAVMAVTLAGGLVTQYVAPAGLLPYAGLVALGSLAAARPPRVSLPALAALLALSSLNFLSALTEDAQFAMALPVVVWALGEAVRSRRAAIEQESRRAVTEEQARIARELHDVIAHSVSVIVVQAAAADDVFDERPDQARESLRSIETAGRSALGELRRLLAAVRPGAEQSEARQPQPGLDRLPELAAALRTTGLRVTLRRDTGPAPLAAGVELTAYRIVQEALTNTLRHADANRVEVTVRTTPDLLEVDVTDDGRAAPGAGAGRVRWAGEGGGFGIAGMRERAAVLGGSLEAGPLPDGGFRVRARLPVEVAP